MAAADVRLRAMTREEFVAWSAIAIRDYAEELVKNRRTSPDRATAKSADDFAELLPDGIGTPGHRLFTASDEATGETVGVAWLGPRPYEHDPAIAWIYDIEVVESARGNGYGRRLMELLEEVARTDGMRRIELNVFGHNEIARNLYASMSYVEITRQMGKELA